MDSFRILSTEGLRQAMAAVERRWDAQPGDLERFRGWAWSVAANCETLANADLPASADLMRAERTALHRVIAERLHLVGGVCGELVSKRAFLEYLEGVLAAQLNSAAA